MKWGVEGGRRVKAAAGAEARFRSEGPRKIGVSARAIEDPSVVVQASNGRISRARPGPAQKALPGLGACVVCAAGLRRGWLRCSHVGVLASLTGKTSLAARTTIGVYRGECAPILHALPARPRKTGRVGSDREFLKKLGETTADPRTNFLGRHAFLEMCQ